MQLFRLAVNWSKEKCRKADGEKYRKKKCRKEKYRKKHIEKENEREFINQLMKDYIF